MPRMADGRDMPHATFVRPDLGSFCRLDELGLQVVGQRLEPGRAVLACRIVETDEFARWCRRCGGEAAPRDSVTRRLAHEPLRWRPTTLLITIRIFARANCMDRRFADVQIIRLCSVSFQPRSRWISCILRGFGARPREPP